MAANVVIKQEKNAEVGPSSSGDVPTEAEAEARIMELLKQFPKGITDKVLTNDMPNLPKVVIVNLFNKLLTKVLIIV